MAQLEASVVGESGGASMARKGIAKERLLLQIVSEVLAFN